MRLPVGSPGTPPRSAHRWSSSTEVRRLRRVSERFRLETTGGPLEARTVVVATGGFHVPQRPPIAERIPEAIVQLHSNGYRNASSLPEGAVLVVGSGQSGVQIAEELQATGRRVFLSVGSAGRFPRRYRGQRHLPLAGRGGGAGRCVRDPRCRRWTGCRTRAFGWQGIRTARVTAAVTTRTFAGFAAEGMTLLGRIEAIDEH